PRASRRDPGADEGLCDEPPRAGAVAPFARPSAHRAGRGQPFLAAVLRHRDHQDVRGLRPPEPAAFPSGAARPPGDAVHRRRMGREDLHEEAGDVGHLPPELAGDARSPGARPRRCGLDAEMVRDQILFVSGLLVEQVGGASVKPPQPEGLWEAVGYTGSNTYRFVRDPEPQKVFRRSMYIFWKRTSAPPQMTLFDAPSREACIARRERTNTPLQALFLMNEPQCFEAARHFAQKAIQEGGASPQERAAGIPRRAPLRPPDPKNVADLVAVYTGQLQAYTKDPESAKKAISFGDLPADASIPARELASRTLVANAILNLDEFVNKR